MGRERANGRGRGERGVTGKEGEARKDVTKEDILSSKQNGAKVYWILTLNISRYEYRQHTFTYPVRSLALAWIRKKVPVA